MENNEKLKELMAYFEISESRSLNYDERSLLEDYNKGDGAQSLAIKILSIFGGILASLAFLGFIFLAELYDSDFGLLMFGVILIIGSIWVNKEFDKVFIDTISISFFIIGFILIGFGLIQLKVDENMLSLLFIGIALSTLRVVQNYMLSFISVLIIHGSILYLILSNDAWDLIHFYVAALALAVTYIFLSEARIIAMNKVISRLYNPVKTAFVFSFLSGLIFLGKKDFIPVSTEFIWLSSIVIIALIVYLISTLLAILKSNETRHKTTIYGLTLLTLLPSAYSPAIPGAILIMLLSFLINYKTGFVISMIAFVYFISQYYYDLELTLLTKSILLFFTGVLFIVFYLLTQKKLTANEEV